MNDLLIELEGGGVLRGYLAVGKKLTIPDSWKIVSISVVEHEHDWLDCSNLVENFEVCLKCGENQSL